MRLSKRHIQIIDGLRNGDIIWTAAGLPYLAKKTAEGHYKSELLNTKVFATLRDNKLIQQAGTKWVVV